VNVDLLLDMVVPRELACCGSAEPCCQEPELALITRFTGDQLNVLAMATNMAIGYDKEIAAIVGRWFSEDYPDDESEAIAIENERLVELLRDTELSRHALHLATNQYFDAVAVTHGFKIQPGREVYTTDEHDQLWIEVRR
jgi:hypothetical protein